MKNELFNMIVETNDKLKERGIEPNVMESIREYNEGIAIEIESLIASLKDKSASESDVEADTYFAKGFIKGIASEKCNHEDGLILSALSITCTRLMEKKLKEIRTSN